MLTSCELAAVRMESLRFIKKEIARTRNSAARKRREAGKATSLVERLSLLAMYKYLNKIAVEMEVIYSRMYDRLLDKEIQLSEQEEIA